MRYLIFTIFIFFTKFSYAKIFVKVHNVKKEEFFSEINVPCTVNSENYKRFYAIANGRVDFISTKLGGIVKKGDLLISIDSKIADSLLASSVASHAAIEASFLRDQQLFRNNVLSQQKLELSKKAYYNSIAELENAKERYENMIIRSPFDGVSDISLFSVGSYVKTGDYLLSLKPVDSAKIIRFFIPEKKNIIEENLISHLISKDGTEYKVDNVRISNFLDNKTGSYVGEAIVKDKNDLTENSFEKLRIRYNYRNSLSIPEYSVVKTDDGNKIYIITDGKAKFIKVELGERNNGMIEVTSSNISENDFVITEGINKIYNDVEVKILN